MDQAITEYRTAIRFGPNLAEAHVNLGCVLRECGKLDEAAACHQQAIRLKPTYADAHNNLGNVHYDRGRLQEAVACFEEALRHKANFPEAQYNLGAAYRDLGDFDKAVAHFQESLRLKPNLGHAYYNLGHFATRGRYRFSNDDIDALRNLLVDCRLPSLDQSLLHFTLADILDKRDCCDEAFEHYRQGNDLRRHFLQQRGQAFNPGKTMSLSEQIIATFNSAYFKRVESFGLDTELPVFIVGMPLRHHAGGTDSVQPSPGFRRRRVEEHTANGR